MAKKKPKLPIGDPDDPQSLYYYLLRFLEHIKTLNHSPRTLEARESCNRKFISWCDQRAMAHPSDITKPVLERYQRHLFLARKANGQALSAATQHAHLRNIKAYFKWLARGNHILSNPASDLEMPKVPKRLPKNILNPSQADMIINQADTTTIAGLRDRAMMEVLYSSGIRRMELSQLQTTDIDTDKGTLMVSHGKGARDRLIPIGDRAISWVNKYINQARPELATDESSTTLFLTLTGRPMSMAWLSTVVKRYVVKADIGKTGSCHLFRHTMATVMLENGADIRYIQAMLGHVCLSTTEIYTHVSIGKLKEIHTATHPAKNEPRSKQ